MTRLEVRTTGAGTVLVLMAGLSPTWMLAVLSVEPASTASLVTLAEKATLPCWPGWASKDQVRVWMPWPSAMQLKAAPSGPVALPST